jgi:hypothetical protein
LSSKFVEENNKLLCHPAFHKHLSTVGLCHM